MHAGHRSKEVEGSRMYRRDLFDLERWKVKGGLEGSGLATGRGQIARGG
jgi:hypothetical protein